jgi:uncharacterized protein
VPRAFLTAEWRNLLMLNFAVEPQLLRPFVPAGTELDAWQGQTFVSLVGFLFANTRLLGVPIPGHRTFEEVNLRFYVRREVAGEERRAVTFIRELVPKLAIAIVARLAYNEPYTALPMRHRFGPLAPSGVPAAVEYGWRLASGWAELRGRPIGEGVTALTGTHEAFITEHYWGYTRQRDGATIEYQVAHPTWRVWGLESPEVRGDLSTLYGEPLSSILRGPLVSAFLADGSPVSVHLPTRLPPKPTIARQAAR